LILKNLHCTKFVQNWMFLVSADSERICLDTSRGIAKKEMRQLGCRTPGKSKVLYDEYVNR
jgi:hypothetical protein